MSFILSALKKVENKRNLGLVPELSSIQVQSFDNLDSRRNRLGIVLASVGVVSVSVFVALWFYKPLTEQSTAEQKAQSVVIETPVIDGAISQPQTPVVQTPPPLPQTNVAPAVVISPGTVPYVVPNNSPPAYSPTQPQTPNSNVAAQSPNYKPPVSPYLYQNPADAPQWQPLPVGIVNYEDLPSGLRQRIPTIKLSAHIHSDLRPQARKVIINGVALRERQRLSDDLSVHQINSDGVILDYQGTLFLLNKSSIFN